MKKIFSFTIVAAAVSIMVSCGNNTNTTTESVDSVATEPESEVVAEPEPEVLAEPEVHQRYAADYTVTLPAGWVADEYLAEMIVKNEAKNLMLRFREYPTGDFDKCVANSGGTKENRGEDVVADNGVVWQVYKATRDEYNTCYLGKMPNNEVIIVWATPDDPTNADVHEIIKSVALK
ncbi:MAG: hypothetical protein IKI67_04425 [Bacteroidales bacterium]|nr:hypothetical protein [Bacteroidales bacterium]